ncbi:hypothetical protein CFSAN001084_17058 [Salmonella enterica subsp. enterica serovar Eastbourne str. CFSAN001084]|nr:hypothetical protein CFSAN001084_17058 [Salmonella enterica subsp. enterica serovar Eastbourne str. CFSAN001084]
MLNSIFIIFCLIAVSAFFSISEISLAASRKIKLKLLADEGSINAQRVLKMQENPGMFFTVVQIGLTAVTPSLFLAVSSAMRHFRPPFPPFSRTICRQNSPSS